MNKEFIMIGAMLLVSVLVTSIVNVGAQNATTNASNTAGNLSASANQTASELGQNASSAVNATGETLEEIGKNASEVGKDILTGAANIFGNITGEIKEGVNGSK